jgi:hypothetical protein
VWAERNKVPIIAQHSGAEPAAVIFDGLQAARARNIDVLIADTAGRLHTQTHLMDELKKVKRVLARLDPGLRTKCCWYWTAPSDKTRSRKPRIQQGLGVTGLVITKLDGTAKGGVVLAIAQKLKIPIRFVGVGEETEDFGVFNAAEFVVGAAEVGEVGGRVPGAPAGGWPPRMIRFDQVHKRYANGREALAGVSFNIEGRRAGIFDRTFRCRQEQHPEADRAHRASDARAGLHQQSEHLRGQAPRHSAVSAAHRAWCFRITNCCTTVPSRTTSRCR